MRNGTPPFHRDSHLACPEGQIMPTAWPRHDHCQVKFTKLYNRLDGQSRVRPLSPIGNPDILAGWRRRANHWGRNVMRNSVAAGSAASVLILAASALLGPGAAWAQQKTEFVWGAPTVASSYYWDVLAAIE